MTTIRASDSSGGAAYAPDPTSTAIPASNPGAKRLNSFGDGFIRSLAVPPGALFYHNNRAYTFGGALNRHRPNTRIFFAGRVNILR
jgi:hypothetical protein